MYIYEKFFTVTKVHGYKISSLQRSMSSLEPRPLPTPPTARQQPLAGQCLEKPRALRVQLSPRCSGKHGGGLRKDLATCLPGFPFAFLWNGGE